MSGVIRQSINVRQPLGGYLRIRDMDVTEINDITTLHNRQDQGASLKIIALAVDHLTHILLGFDKQDTFLVSMMGSKMVNEQDQALELLEKIDGLEDESIINTCKLVGYRALYRGGKYRFVPIEEIEPSEETIEDIRTMVTRSLKFFEESGPILKNHITFEGAYTSRIRTGEVDFLTEDAIWDFKILKHPVRKEDTLQLLLYYLLGLQSHEKEKFEKLTKIGIYNPRLNVAYTIDVDKIDETLKKEIYERIIGY